MNGVHYSSKSDNWATPTDFFRKVEAEFGLFDLDPCADGTNYKSSCFYTAGDDGLEFEWFGRVWCNPPYGRGIGKWVERAVDAAFFHKLLRRDEMVLSYADLVVMLLPARTDTKWWHDYVIPHASEIRFIRGRLKFGGAKNSAPFPSALVIFRQAS